MAENEESGDAAAAGTDRLFDLLTRFRAWESLLCLFFARYYMDRDDPMDAAMWDRDWLIGRHKAANDEDGAHAVEVNYETLRVMIEAAQRLKAGQGREKDRAFLYLVPPPEKPDKP